MASIDGNHNTMPLSLVLKMSNVVKIKIIAIIAKSYSFSLGFLLVGLMQVAEIYRQRPESHIFINN